MRQIYKLFIKLLIFVFKNRRQKTVGSEREREKIIIMA